MEVANMIVFGIVGLLFLSWVLWRRKWRLPVVCLVLLSAVAVLILWLVPNSTPPVVVALICLPLAIFVGTFQALVVWLFFKPGVLLQDRQFFPAQMMHSHFCWGFLTSYLILGTVSDAPFFSVGCRGRLS